MELYDLLYRLYTEFDTETLRSNQKFVDLLPPLDSPLALEQWQSVKSDLAERRGAIERAFQENGEALATIAAHATRDQAFTALDLYSKHGRAINVLVLDVDETLRSAGNTDNEIPRETLHLLTQFHESGVPIVICTGQTLENVKGFLIQGLGNEIVYSGRTSIVYEAGTGVFTPEHGPRTKQLLYEELDDTITAIFRGLRSSVLSEAPQPLRETCHLQGNEFNVTLKPNSETGSQQAHEVIDDALVYLIDLLGTRVAEQLEAESAHSGGTVDSPGELARAYYAAEDPEIADVLESNDAEPSLSTADVPGAYEDIFERIDVAYYAGDAAEIGSLELNKVEGVKRAFDVLGVDDPFALVMGDSKSDLRVMQWLADIDGGLAAAPTHASEQVLEHVQSTDDLVFDQGDAAQMLRIAFALNAIVELE
ncbi:HAD family hydrolase [Halovenus marina]|uniref:HAD family hydrolase n=1 Tax=Halovenus marina TaxID=3396621 RepID=UPI003F543809